MNIVRKKSVILYLAPFISPGLLALKNDCFMLLQATVALLVNRKWKHSRNLSCNSVRNNKTNKGSERDLTGSVRSRQPACLLSYIKKTGAMQSSFRFRQSGPLSPDQETLQPIRDGGAKKVSLVIGTTDS